MKKIYLILSMLCLQFYGIGQTTVIIYATGTSGSFTTGNSTNTTRTDGNIVSTSTTQRGYAVFNLSSIPAGSSISSCVIGFNVATYGGSGTPSGWATRGYAGNLSTVSTASTLFADMAAGTPLTAATYGTATGVKTLASTAATTTFMAANIGSFVSICWTGGNARIYTITGETGTATTTGAHAPYLQITYTPPCSGAPAPGNTVASSSNVCVGNTASLSLQNTTTGNGVSYQWYSAPDLSGSPGTYTSIGGATGATYAPVISSTTWYKCAVTCSFSSITTFSNQLQITSLSYPVPISGSTTVCNYRSITLSDATGGGSWSSGNTSIATVNSSGAVTGVSVGTVPISYTSAGGCSVSTTVTVIAAPAVMTITPATSYTICPGSSVNPTASSFIPVPTVLLSQNFNSSMTDQQSGTLWTVVNTGASSIYNWAIVSAGSLPDQTSCTGDGSSYMAADADEAGVVTLTTSLISPSFSTVGYSGVNISFNYYYEYYGSDYNVEVDYSTDGGTTWNLVNSFLGTSAYNYTWTAGSPNATLSLPSGALGQSNVMLRWYYSSYYGWQWIVDNIVVSSTSSAFASSAYTWSGPSGLSCISCTSPTIIPPSSYGNDVYTVSVTYNGCTAIGTASILVNKPGTFGGNVPVCQGASTTTLTNTSAGGTWSSGTPGIATVGASTGVVTGVSSGNASIFYTLPPGCTGATVVTVNPLPNITGINTSAANGCVGSGTTVTITSSSLSAGTYTVNYSYSGANTGSGAATMVVSGTSGTFNIPSLSFTGSTTVTVSAITNSSGCSANLSSGNTATFNVNPLPGAISGTNVVCTGFTTTLSDAGGGSWSSGNTSIASVNSSGVVSGVAIATGSTLITYTLPTGCLVTTPYTVNVTPAISGTVGACAGGSATLSDPSGGGAWSSSNTAVATIGSSSGTYLGVAVGTAIMSYTLPATGCYATIPVSVTPPPGVYIVSGGGNFCPGGTGVDVSMTGSGTGYYYQLYLNGVAVGGLISGTGSAIDFGLQTTPGTYTVTANPGTSCAINMGGGAIVSIYPAPAVFNVSGGGGYCAGGTGVHIGLSGSNTGISYQLFKAGSTVGSPLAGTSTILDFGLLSAVGTYSVVATNTITGCTSNMNGSATVSVNPLPTAFAVTGGAGSYCAGGSGWPVGMSSSTSGISYQLYNSGLPVGIPVIAAGGAFSFGSQTLAGIYTVVATNPATACAANMTGSASVTINPLPAAFALSGGGSVCAGGTGVHVGMSGSASGVTYTLYWGGISTGVTASGTGSAVDFGAFAAAGVYTAVATSAAGCSSNMVGSVTISVNPTPGVFTVTGGGAYCAGGSGVHVGLSGSAPGVSYYLYNGTTIIGGASGTSAALDFGLELAAGTYTVIATISGTGCSATMAGSATVSVNPLPNAYIVSGGGTYCAGGTGQHVLLGGSNTGISYQVLNGGVPAGTATPGSGSAIDFGAFTAAGNYTVVATNTVTVCSAGMTGSATISISPLPTPFNMTGGGSYCAGGAGVHIGLNGSNSGISYQLLNGGTPAGAAISGTGSALDFGLKTLTGAYTVLATNTTTTCTNTMTGSATVSSVAAPSAYSMTGGGNYCVGGTGMPVGLSNSDAGTLYQLYRGGTAVGGAVAGTGSTLNFGLQTVAGTYTVTGTSTSTGCAGPMSGSASIAVTPLPTVFTVMGGGNYCVGGTGPHISLSGSTTGANYRLYNGGTPIGAGVSGSGMSLDFGPQTSGGAYTVIATSAGCTNTMAGSALISVTVNPLPAAYSVTGGGGYCSGGAGVHTGLATSAPGISYQLYYGVSGMGAALAGTGGPLDFGLQTMAGSYTVVGTNTVTGCANNMAGSAGVNINPLPVIHTVTGGGNYCVGGTGVNVGLNGTNAGVSYQLYNGSAMGSPMTGSGPAISFGLQTIAGAYTVQATEVGTGCVSNMTGSAAVSISAAPTIFNVTGGGNYCSSGSGVPVGLGGSDLGMSYQLYNGTAIGLPVTGTGSAISFGIQTLTGSYTVIANGGSLACVATMNGSATVSVNATPATHNVSGGGSYCMGGSGVPVGLNLADVGVNYQLYDGAAVGSPVSGAGLALSFGLQTRAGTYTVIATNATTGCTSTMTGSQAVAINPLPAIYAMAGGGGYCAGGPGADVQLAASQIGINYQLYNGTSPMGIPVPGTGAVLDFGPQPAGVYTISATNPGTFCGSNMTGSVTVTANPLPGSYPISGGGVFCAGGAGVPVQMTGSQNGISYQLYNGTTATGAPITGSGSAISFGLQTASGNYTVRGTDIISGCVNAMTGSATVSASPLPTAYSVTGSSPAYCAGGAGVIVSLTGSDMGVNYQLKKGGVPTGSAIPGSGIALSFGPQSVAGTYTVVASNASSGCTTNMTGAAPVAINPAPKSFAVTGGGAYCAGGAGEHVWLANSTSGIDYRLFEGSTIIDSAVTSVGGLIDFGLQTAAGNYTVVATNPVTGCTGNMTGSVSVGINPLPATYTVTGGGVYCAGDAGVSVALSNSAAGTNYQLYVGSTAVGSVMYGSGTALNFGYQTAMGVYTVVAANGVTGCQDTMSGSASVAVNATPAVYPVGGGGSYCSGGPGVHIGLSNSSAGVSYQLQVGGISTGSLVHGTGAALDMGLQTVPGLYTVTGTDNTTACASNMAGSVSITLNSLPAIYPVTGGGNYCLGGAGVHIGLSNSVTGINYTLYSGSAITTLPGTGGALDFGLQATASTYTAVAQNAATLCSSNMSGSATIVVNPVVVPAVTLTTPEGNNGCTGRMSNFTAVTANGGSAPVYQWSVNSMPFGGSGNTLSYLPAGGDVVSVQLTSSAPCATPLTAANSMTMTVSTSESPTVAITANPGAEVCQGSSVTLSTVPDFAGSVPTYTWVKNGTPDTTNTSSSYSYVPSNGDHIYCVLHSSYVCRITDTAHSSTISIQTDVPPTPVVAVTASNNGEVVAGAQEIFTATATNAGPSPSYQWYVNSIAVPGATLPVFESKLLEDQDVVMCTVTSDGICSGITASGSATVHVWNVGIKPVSVSSGLINVLPNPNKGTFNVSGALNTTADENLVIEVTDLLGHVVYQDHTLVRGGIINVSVQLDRSIANGMYLLNVRSGSESHVFHVVVEQ